MSNDQLVEATRAFVEALKQRPEGVVNTLNLHLEGCAFRISLQWVREPKSPQEASVPYLLGDEV